METRGFLHYRVTTYKHACLQENSHTCAPLEVFLIIWKRHVVELQYMSILRGSPHFIEMTSMHLSLHGNSVRIPQLGVPIKKKFSVIAPKFSYYSEIPL